MRLPALDQNLEGVGRGEERPAAVAEDAARQLGEDVQAKDGVDPRVAGPRFLLAAAGFRDRAGDGRAALELYARVHEGAADSEEAFLALLRSGEVLGRAGNATRARDYYAAARAHRSCTGHWPARIDGLLAALPA